MEIADFLGQEGRHALEEQGEEPEHGIIISVDALGYRYRWLRLEKTNERCYPVSTRKETLYLQINLPQR